MQVKHLSVFCRSCGGAVDLKECAQSDLAQNAEYKIFTSSIGLLIKNSRVSNFGMIFNILMFNGIKYRGGGGIVITHYIKKLPKK